MSVRQKIIASHGWTWQKNKAGVTRVTNVTEAEFGGHYGWLDSAERKSFHRDQFWATKREAVEALAAHLFKDIEKTRRRLEKLEATYNKLEPEMLADYKGIEFYRGGLVPSPQPSGRLDITGVPRSDSSEIPKEGT